jgi:hypothetical protein
MRIVNAPKKTNNIVLTRHQDDVAVISGVEKPDSDVIDRRRAVRSGGVVVDVEAADLDLELAPRTSRSSISVTPQR